MPRQRLQGAVGIDAEAGVGVTGIIISHRRFLDVRLAADRRSAQIFDPPLNVKNQTDRYCPS